MVFLRPIKKDKMSKKKQANNNEEVFEQVEQSLNRVEQFIEDNSQNLLYALGGIAAIIVGFWSYNTYVAEPAEKEAENAAFMAQVYFEQDSMKLALDGNINHMGFLEIADEYSGTEMGNLAHYYAGMAYLKMAQYENAIGELDKYSSIDEIFGALSKAAIGDCFNELNQPKEALDYYKKALSIGKNDLVTPAVLKKAALTAQMLEKYADAAKYWNQLATEYSKKPEAADAAKYAAMAESAK